MPYTIRLILSLCALSLALVASESNATAAANATHAPAQNCPDSKESAADTKLDSEINSESSSTSQSPQAKSVKDDELEVFVDEGVIYQLDKGDAAFAVYGEEYALVPLSKGLQTFLAKQDSSTHSRALKVADSTLQIQSNGEGITFYRSSKKGSNLYSKIAPKRYKLTPEEFVDESVQPQEVRQIYRIQNFDEAILNAKCAIIQSRGFIQDRSRSALVINLDKDINPRLLSEGQRELFLECRVR